MLFQKIKSGKYDDDDPIWDNISNEAKDLVAKLLTIDAKKRLTAEQVQRLAGVANDAVALRAYAIIVQCRRVLPWLQRASKSTRRSVGVALSDPAVGSVDA